MLTPGSNLLIFTISYSIIILNGVYGLEDLMGSEIQDCLNCLCHARSGCWNRLNCADYSISESYWRLSGSPTTEFHFGPDGAYESCMHDENCILNMIKNYTERFGELDCNCDGVFDCKDRFAIHLFGQDCKNPKYGEIYAMRFNHCAGDIGVSPMSAIEGDCEPETFV